MAKLKYNVGDNLITGAGDIIKVLLSFDGVVGLSLLNQPTAMGMMLTYEQLEKDGYKKVEPKKEWYENIPRQGVWCWCYSAGDVCKHIKKIQRRDYDSGHYRSLLGEWVGNAQPLTKEEVEKYILQ